ncbi:SURF1 family protein [Agromyces atrinae]|uniref:SURF1 family cytochrome oxidase biogenesis protein n=1 Tax=Agromyces atrinae TaxID=592376 RepID=UPI001F5A756D|nr:SURF1 family protein [Agromyces atrinae]MCI2956677.1 SURF1 family protein [Agromyces atrinae]
MTEGTATGVASPGADLEPKRRGELVTPLAQQPRPAAVYDTVTEGMTGWRFLRTGRWIAYLAAAILFAVICMFLANWQFSRGQQVSTDNAIASANFDATPVAIDEALPELDSYDATLNWQRVEATGVYRSGDELLVRNRFHEGDKGFEVLTPFDLSDGTTLIVNRGWVAASAADDMTPEAIPAAPRGEVDVVVRLRPTEAPRGSAVAAGSTVSSITLATIGETVDGELYTGAYGLLDTQQPPGDAGLTPIQTEAPREDAAMHYSYAVQWPIFAVIGFVAFGLGARREYRRLNIDDPREQERANERARKDATKPFTDEELEDESLDGYLSLARWGGSQGLPGAASRIAVGGSQRPADRAIGSEAGTASAAPAEPIVYRIHSVDEGEPADDGASVSDTDRRQIESP